MQQSNLNLNEFQVARVGERTERIRAIRRQRQRVRLDAESRVRANSMMMKIAICTLALLIVIGTEIYLLTDVDGRALEASQTVGEETEQEESLGRLKFIALHETESVFSPSQRWSSPVAAAEASLMEDQKLLKLTAAAGSTVSLPAAGEVKELFSDEVYGTGLRISHGNGLESLYYGIFDIQVEEGQPLLAYDTLGEMPEGGTIYVALQQSGSALCPTDIIDPAWGI